MTESEYVCGRCEEPLYPIYYLLPDSARQAPFLYCPRCNRIYEAVERRRIEEVG